MDKRVWWVVGLIILIALLYVFFKPTGTIVLEPDAMLFEENQTNETIGEIVLAPGEIGSCGKLNTAGTYTLTKNVAGEENKSCFVVTASGVIVDCKGYSIIGGIVSEQQGTIIKDCNADKLNVNGNGSLSVEKTMVVGVVNQKKISVKGANVKVTSSKGNESVSVSGTSNSDGLVSLSVISSSYNGAGEKIYDSFSIEISLNGFNSSVSAISSIGNVNASIDDITAPTITASSNPSVTSNSVRVGFDVQDASGIDNCTAVINERSQEFTRASSTSINIGGNSINVGGLSHETDYETYVVCTDKAGLEGTSLSVSFTTSEETSSSSGAEESSGSGNQEEASSSETQQQNIVPGSVIGMTYQISQEQLASGYTKALKADDKVRIDGVKGVMLFQVISLGDDSVEISANENTKVIKTGASENFDFDNDRVYDVKVSLSSIEGSTGSLTFLGISESVAEISTGETGSGGEVQKEIEQTAGITGRAAEGEKGTSSSKIWILLVLVVAAIAGVAMYKRIKKAKETTQLE